MEICFNPNEKGNIIEFTSNEREKIKKSLIEKEKSHGIDGCEIYSPYNNYDNDDYLYLWSLIQRVNNLYEKQNLISPPNIWRKNYRQVPYIHLEFFDYNCVSTDENGEIYVDDRKLMVRTEGPVKKVDKEYYIVYFDVKFLQRYISFISNFFYSNNDNRPEEIRFSNGLTFSSLKPIFSTTGFKKFSGKNQEIMCDIFEKSLMMIIAHEYSHISNAHCIMKSTNPDYVKDINISFCLESNADDNAIRLIVSSLLYDGIKNPADYNLVYSYEEFADEWSLYSFSAFLALTWTYQGENRKWDENTVGKYLESLKEHPMYQLRAYNVINRAVNHTYAILGNKDITHYKTKDGYCLDKELADYIANRTIDMIRSFDYCLYYFNEPDLQVLNKLLSSNKNELTHLEDKSASPISMMFENEDAKQMNDSIKSNWKQVKAKLEEFNPYCMLYDTI